MLDNDGVKFGKLLLASADLCDDGGQVASAGFNLDLSGFNRSLAVRDNLACLAAGGGGVHFVDVGNPADPVYLATVISSLTGSTGCRTPVLMV